MSVSRLRAGLALGLAGAVACAFAAPQLLAQSMGKPVAQATSTASHQARVKPGLLKELDTLSAASPYGAFLHFAKGSTVAAQNSVITGLGLQIGSDFRRYTDSVYVTGPVSAFRAAMLAPSIYYIEQNRQLRFMNDTGPWATKVRVAQEAVSGGPYKDAAGNVLMGQGIGIGIVDSGINALNPDLKNRVGKNFKIECPGFILVNPPAVPGTEKGCVFQDVGNMATTDQGGGHGTHVSGIAAGDGTASTATYAAGATPAVPGSFAGVAPRATLHGFSTGEGINVLFATESIQYILDHYNDFTPRIRVTNHSYGVGADMTTGASDPHDPDDTEAQLTRVMVSPAFDIVMVYAAGNDGTGVGDAGAVRETSPGCQNPVPGVICAAGHFDGNTGDPDFSIYGSTSRGLKTDITSYPDLAAPGQEITSTCGPGAGAICQSIPSEPTWGGQYGTISGTSMATPNIAGAVALIRQARPDLKAPEIEKLLKRTARKVTYNGAYIPDIRIASGGVENDANNDGIGDGTFSQPDPKMTTNFGVGAGLLDVQAALDALGVSHPGLPASTTSPLETVLADGDTDNAQSVAGAADVTKLTVQEAARGASSGLTFRLTVRDATAFGSQSSGVGYRLNYNVAGIAYDTAANYVSVAAGPVVAASKAAPATVSRTGNVITLFVPIARVGSPAIGTPIHNMRLQVVDLGNASGPSLDRVPSKSGSAGAQSDIEPAFAMPYTILRPLGAAAESTETACAAPGITLLEDKQGDIFALTPAAPPNNGTPALDIRKLSIVQPYVAVPPATDYKIELHLKMQSFDPLPVGTWPVSFCSPKFACVNPDTNTAPYSATNKYYTVRMTTDSSLVSGATPQAPVFQLLQPTEAGVTTASRAIKVITTLGSSFDATGLIKFSLNAADIGLDVTRAGKLDEPVPIGQPKKPAQILSQFQVRVSGPGTPTPDNMPDGLAGMGSYLTLPLDQCNPSNVAPVATLTADRNIGFAPMTVVYTLSASDPGDSFIRYSLDFGDDTLTTVNAPTLPATVSHTYSAVGSYSARLTVVDSHQKASNLAQQDIMAKDTANNVKPTAALAASPTSGHGPLSVDLSAAASSDTDGRIVEYRFNFGDGSAEVKQAGAAIRHVYAKAGKFNATLTVVDDLGAVSTAAISPEITVTNTAPVASLSATPSSGTAPLTVTLSGAASSDADGDALSNYHFDCGNGVVRDLTANSTSCVYEAAGSYTASLAVTDSLSSISAAVEQVITVAEGQAGEAAAFSFIERRNVPLNTFVYSESVTLSGFTGTLPISATDGLQYSINSGPFTTAAGSVQAGAKLVVRHVSASTENTAKEGTVTVGSKSAVFRSVTTTVDRVPDAFSFGSKTEQAPGTVVESVPTTLTGYDEAVIVAGPGISYRVDSGAWTSARGNLVKGQVLTVRHTTSADSLGYTKTYLKVGGVTGYFTTRTRK